MNDICLSCFGRLPDDSPRTGCEACEYSVHTWLRELPRHLVLLADMLTPDTGPARRGGVGRAHAPLPVRLEVLDLTGPGHPVPWSDVHGDQTGGVPITPLLYGWARYLAADSPAVRTDAHGTVHVERCDGALVRTGADVPGLCRWLDAYLPYAATRPWWDDLYEQLEQLLHRVRRLTHTRPVTRAKDAPCPSCSAWSLVEREDELHITCTICPARLTPDEYDEHRAQVMPALASLALRIAATQQTAA
ncbi:hypothetical protein [Streptomyces sp. EN27]|uniref:hypothetical protein n=1 Tax=Streptomyces sp. EN27 TaxID=211464 RepID=UPI000851BE47|nr:hypothetical protein [Streptomyces sp. EN27]